MAVRIRSHSGFGLDGWLMVGNDIFNLSVIIMIFGVLLFCGEDTTHYD